jgi:hypothetical protein
MLFIGTNVPTLGWIERYDPSFAKWVGSSMHFAFVKLASERWIAKLVKELQ